MSALFLLLLACQSEPQPVVSRLRGHGDGVGGLTVALREGLSDDAEITVWTRADADAEWVEAEVTSTGGDDRLEVVVVADNSGSEDGYLPQMQAAVEDFGLSVLERGLDDRVALVRVSTESSVVQEPTADADAWAAAVDSMFITNGWTALWDGVRLGNEVLQQGAEITPGAGLEVCMRQSRRAAVVFTDGQENNSADEHETSYDGDGVDTTLVDLFTLDVLGVPTPLHTIGIGNYVDEDALSALASATGGAYAAIADYEELALALTETASGLDDEIPVCFEVATCSDQQGQVRVVDGEESWSVDFDLPGLCGCTRTRGYWSTHPEAWPVDSLDLGGDAYDQAAALAILDSDTSGDKSLQMASQLIAAKLNVASGADDSDIASEIEAADAWLSTWGIGTDVRSWHDGEATKDALDAWNNGDTGPGHCD